LQLTEFYYVRLSRLSCPVRQSVVSKAALHRLCAIIHRGQLLGGAATAQEKFPSRPIEIVVPAPAGGSLDTAFRILEPSLSARLGVPLVFLNRPGASGTIGMASVTRARADGNQKFGQVLHVYISRSEDIGPLSPKVDNVTPRFDSRARIEGGVAERMSMQIDDRLPPSRAVYLLRFILRPSSITSSYSRAPIYSPAVSAQNHRRSGRELHETSDHELMATSLWIEQEPGSGGASARTGVLLAMPGKWRNGPQIDHSNPVNGCEQRCTDGTKNIDCT
jgi:hypothetical protein